MKSDIRKSVVEVLSRANRYSKGSDKFVLIELGLTSHRDSKIFQLCLEPFLSGISSSILSVNASKPTFMLPLVAEKAKIAATRTSNSRFDWSVLANSIERERSAMITALS